MGRPAIAQLHILDTNPDEPLPHLPKPRSDRHITLGNVGLKTPGEGSIKSDGRLRA
jgi:hypothetical protein